MTPEEMKKLAKSNFEELFDKGNLAVLDDIIGEDFTEHDPAGGADGREAYRQAVLAYRIALPDIHVSVEDLIVEGERVAIRWRVNATHNGELMGIPPSGKKIEVTGISIDRIADGKIVETWGNWDTLGLLKQIGAIPSE